MKETDEFLKEYEKTKESLKSMRLYLVDEHARHRTESSSSSSSSFSSDDSDGSSWRRTYDRQTGAWYNVETVNGKDGQFELWHQL